MGDSSILESAVPLSRSLLWQRQRDFYRRRGLAAWTDEDWAQARSQIQGANEDYFSIREWQCSLGAPFDKADVVASAKLCVIGQTVRQQLFGSGEAVGEIVRVSAADPLNLAGIILPGPRVSALSGGNQQKVVVGKWLSFQANVLLLADPAKGVDVGAKRDLYEYILKQVRGNRMSVILYASDNEELIQYCDRLLIMYEGQIVAILEGNEINDDMIVAASLRVR